MTSTTKEMMVGFVEDEYQVIDMIALASDQEVGHVDVMMLEEDLEELALLA